MNESGPLAKPGPIADFAVVIPSASAANLVPCVRAILEHEPALSPERIIVVDDGARVDAEPRLPGVRWVTGVKPFVFARNVNLGIRAADRDVILLNDDALLVTPDGFTRLAEQVRSRPKLGVCSAGILGVVGNQSQTATGRCEFRDGTYGVSFICVYLPLPVYRHVGPLDERFTGYGFEDQDYCARILNQGLALGIWDGCVVEHPGKLVSSYRSRPDFRPLVSESEQLFVKKWGRLDPTGRMTNPHATPRGVSLRERLRRLKSGEAFGLKPKGQG